MALRDTVDRDGVRLTFYGEHRPLDAYTRAFEPVGLLIEKLREVSVTGDLVSSKWQRIPLFLHLLALKR